VRDWLNDHPTLTRLLLGAAFVAFMLVSLHCANCFANTESRYVNAEHRFEQKAADCIKYANMCLDTAAYWIWAASWCWDRGNFDGYFANLKRAGKLLDRSESYWRKAKKWRAKAERARARAWLPVSA
jgi:hypothetical protein